MGLFRRLFGPSSPSSPRLRDLMERMDELEGDVAGLRKKVVRLQGLVTGGMRHQNDEPGHQDAPALTIAEGDGPQYPPLAQGERPLLARRFRRW